MKIEILNFYLVPQEDGGFDLHEIKKTDQTKKITKNDTTDVTHAYNMTFERCLKRIAHIKASRNSQTVSLGAFLRGYEKLINKLEAIGKEAKL